MWIFEIRGGIERRLLLLDWSGFEWNSSWCHRRPLGGAGCGMASRRRWFVASFYGFVFVASVMQNDLFSANVALHPSLPRRPRRSRRSRSQWRPHRGSHGLTPGAKPIPCYLHRWIESITWRRQRRSRRPRRPRRLGFPPVISAGSSSLSGRTNQCGMNPLAS